MTHIRCCVDLVRKHLASEVGVMVIHNKLKPKRGNFTSDVKYFAGENIEDVWIVYPWDAKDIDEHERLSKVYKVEQ
jgi:hypoxanthine phosphoribosyltransferase